VVSAQKNKEGGLEDFFNPQDEAASHIAAYSASKEDYF